MLLKKITLAAFVLLSGTSFSQTLKDAIKLTENEQFETAGATFKKLSAANTSNAEILFYYGENYFNNEQEDSAKVMYEKGIQVNPTSPLSYVGLGKYYLYKNDAAMAKTNFDKALAIGANKNATVLMEVAEAYINAENKDIQQAFTLLNRATILEPKNPEVYILMGDAFAAKNDGSNAVKNYERAIDLDKTSVKAILRIGQLYGRARNYTEALNYYKRAESIDPNFAPAYSQQGELYYRAQQYDVAKEKYAKYMQLSGNNLSARIRYAGFLFSSKDYEKAISEVNEIKKQDTTNNIVNRIMAYSLYEGASVKNKEEAEKYYKDGLMYIEKFFSKAAPSKIIFSDYEYHAKLLSKTGNDSLAIVKFRQAYDKDTTQVDLLSDIASSHMKLRNYDEAIKVYQEKIAKSTKENPNDYFGLGRAYYYSKDFVNADSAFSKITQITSSWPGGYLWRAKANTQLDPDSKKGLAQPHYEAFIEKVGTDVEKNKRDLIEAYSYLGFYYYDKDKAKSKEMWQKVAELDPKNDKAKKALDGLK